MLALQQRIGKACLTREVCGERVGCDEGRTASLPYASWPHLPLLIDGLDLGASPHPAEHVHDRRGTHDVLNPSHEYSQPDQMQGWTSQLNPMHVPMISGVSARSRRCRKIATPRHATLASLHCPANEQAQGLSEDIILPVPLNMRGLAK